MTDDSADDVLAPAPLRSLAADEYPYPGIVRAGDPPCVWVEAADAPTSLWRSDGAAHLLGPLDAGRTAAGTALLLPLTEGRLTRAIALREPLDAGQAVSVAVSLLRGAEEATELDIPDGSWWLTTEGRPVLALGGAVPWRPATVAALERLAADRTGAVAAALSDAAVLCARVGPPPRAAQRAACEDALFAAAEPRPLGAPHPAAPEPGSGAGAHGVTRRGARAEARDEEPAASRGAFGALAWAAEVFDRDVGRRVRAALPARRSQPRGDRVPVAPPPSADRNPQTPSRRSRVGGHRAPWLLAAGIAIVVVAAGALWPDETARTAGTAGAASSTATPGVTETGPVPGDTEASPRPEAATDDVPGATAPADDPTAGAPASGAPNGASDTAPSSASPPDAAAALLSRWRGCSAADAACREAVLEDPLRDPPSALSALSDAPASTSLVDEYGGAAAVRVEAPNGAARIVVLVRAGERWLIRDVYEVADQP